MTFSAIRLAAKPGLDCYLTSVPGWRIQSFLAHDPRSRHWKLLPPWLREIYETKQRVTSGERIDSLKRYITDRLMDDDHTGALPPISIVQFEPLTEEQVTQFDGAKNIVLLEDGQTEVTRVLIDGLARVTALKDIMEELKTQNPAAYEKISTFTFSVALYVPTLARIDQGDAGQLFTDFNSYAWPVPAAKTLINDKFNLYKDAAVLVGKSEVIIRHGGLKEGSSNLSRKDTAFATLLMMAQFCKVAAEGRRAIGNLNKPIPGVPNISKVGAAEIARRTIDFLTAFEAAITSDDFADRQQLFRTAHGLYALAAIVGDIGEGKTTLQSAVAGLSEVDWTWGNKEFRKHIGRQKMDKAGQMQWHLNTGTQTVDWLIRYCREKSGVPVPLAA